MTTTASRKARGLAGAGFFALAATLTPIAYLSLPYWSTPAHAATVGPRDDQPTHDDARIVEDLATLPPCVTENDVEWSSELPCRWDATVRGNGKGDSFNVLDLGVWDVPMESDPTQITQELHVAYVYDSGTVTFIADPA